MPDGRHSGAALSQRGGLVAGRAGGHAGRVSERWWSTTTAPTAPPRWPAGTAPRWSPNRARATDRRCTPEWRRRRRRSSRSSTPTVRWIPRELPALVDELDRGADMAIGRRRPVPGLRWPWHARLGTAAVCWRLRTRYGLPVHDIAPMRVARRDALLALGITDRRIGLSGRADGARRAGGLDGRRTRCRLRPAHRRQIEGQRIAARQYSCGTGLLAGDLVMPVTLRGGRQGAGGRPGQDPAGGRRRRAGRRRYRRRGVAGHARRGRCDARAGEGGGADRRSGRRQCASAESVRASTRFTVVAQRGDDFAERLANANVDAAARQAIDRCC